MALVPMILISRKNMVILREIFIIYFKIHTIIYGSCNKFVIRETRDIKTKIR